MTRYAVDYEVFFKLRHVVEVEADSEEDACEEAYSKIVNGDVEFDLANLEICDAEDLDCQPIDEGRQDA